jgi:hypothetical protein
VAPTNYIHPSPTDKTVVFAGEFLDIRRMADEEGFNYTYLSHIFSANSPKFPARKVGQQLAEALGMEYPEFIRELLLKKESKVA